MEKHPEKIRAMFAAIARRYDLLNHLLSFGSDIAWRRFAVRRLAAAIDKRGRGEALILDLCCGTGDLSLRLERLGRVIGCDFCHPMLQLAAVKIARRRKRDRIMLVEGDALRLPFPDRAFDAVAIAFGLRNLADTRAGLLQMRRVLRPGGTLAVLEFSRPRPPLFRQVFRFYFKRLLPRIGRFISGERQAYYYLPDSVSTFPDQDGLKLLLEEAGFRDAVYWNLTGGVAALHLASLPSE